MKLRKTLLAMSIITGLCLSGSLHSQDSNAQEARQESKQKTDKADQAKAKELAAVTVTGIRESLAVSLDTKRNANAVVDAITAEDIGKFPSTNVAEAMAQMPGVTIDRRFGQGERVSIDGTDPSLNLSFLDGHPVAQTAWLYGEQPNRGFDYTLLAPEILGRLEVYKSSEARLPEGSIGGTVIMHTRLPLDMAANTVSGSVGLTYNDQASSSKPNASVLYSWKNAANDFGIAVSGSHYEEKVDRQGIEVFGYQPVSDFSGNPAVAAQLASGSLKPGDQVPQEINAAYFQQQRKRNSVTLGLQYKPTHELEFNLNALYIKERFDNFNQSMYGFTSQTGSTNITSLGGVSNGVVQSGHSCGSDTVGCAGPVRTYIDNLVRQSTVVTKGLDLKGAYKGEGWSLTGQAGISKAADENNSQAFTEPTFYGGYSWDINKGQTFDNSAAARNPKNWVADGNWLGNYGKIPAHAKDVYGQVDFSKDFDGPFNELLIGARYAKHNEDFTENVYGGVTPADMSQVGGVSYADTMNAFSGFAPDMKYHIQNSAGAIRSWVLGSPLDYANPDPASYLDNTWKLSQKSTALYGQMNFATDTLHGNFGVRYVRTEIQGSSFNFLGTPVLPAPAAWWQTSKKTHNDWLPSFNIAYDLDKDVVLRFAGAKVMAWAPYNQLLHNSFLNDDTLTGTGGNSNLDPYKSYNFNLSTEWYFADQSVLAASVFYKHVLNYIDTVAVVERQYNSMHTSNPANYQTIYINGKLGNCDTGGFCDYSVLRPVNAGGANIKGFTLSYQQPFGDSGFGMSSNYTYSLGSNSKNQGLPYNSKHSVNLSPYYERGPLSARITYGWRAKYLAGGYVAGAPPATVDDYTELSASLGWKFNDNFSLSLDGMNLLNEKYFQYLGTKEVVAGKYTTGRRYMANVHFKF
ncbi:TonB-dependent receptor [Dyella tabacisoli]|uniref:TonB-dependent receptor n=1 Tax=Dyella tabacisoli TaxID=2282381 RepID=A0A369UQQ4_9GAMM|nr:TonB-dependent receptor [Dyella tabacisoli]RDD80659.1 TonB-dependent receptor [Dyella tabacisoli]